MAFSEIDTRRISPGETIMSGAIHANGAHHELSASDRARIYFIVVKSNEIGAELAEQHPEIAEHYRDVERLPTQSDIARLFLPETFTQSPRFAATIVGKALRLLIPDDERKRLVKERTSKLFRTGQAQLALARRSSMTDEDFREHQRNAALARHKKSPTIEAMIKARGQVPWGKHEKILVYDILINDPDYQVQQGRQKGLPNYQKLADEVNMLFHEGEEVRTAKLVSSMVRDERRKRKNTALSQ